MQYFGAISQMTMISVHFQSKPFTITVIQVTKKDALFIIEDWNAKVGSQEIPGLTGKFGRAFYHSKY